MQGICDHVAKNMKNIHGLDVDPMTDIVICCGQTEAFAAAMFACKFILCLNGTCCKIMFFHHQFALIYPNLMQYLIKVMKLSFLILRMRHMNLVSVWLEECR